MTDDLQHQTWAIAGAISLAAIVAYFAYRNARKGRRAAACVAFRNVVTAQLQSLYPSPVAWSTNRDQRLRTAFPALQAAVAQFRPHVPYLRQAAFDRAWLQYRCAPGYERSIQCYEHYSDNEDIDCPEPDPKTTFKQNVDALLAFANEP